MKTAAALLLAVLLGGCSTFIATMTGDDGGWLIGTWCPDNRTATVGGVEVTLQPTRFHADGRYATFQESGRWRYRDRALRLRYSSNGVRMRRTDRAERLGETAMAWTVADGARETWHRCHATP